MKDHAVKLSLTLILIFTMVMTAYATTPNGADNQMEMQGKVEVLERNGVKIHVYISPEASNLTATYAIETKHKLVLVDAQFHVPYALEFREYVDTLGKPIDRIIISHAHPDHHFGLDAAFRDVPAYALAETIAAIRDEGPAQLADIKENLGDLAPENIMVPEHEITAGSTQIDGLTYKFEPYYDGEDTDQLVIKLPELNVIIVQDLAYNRVHLFTAADLAGWLKILKKLKSFKRYDTVLAGHGEPTTPRVYTHCMVYLKCARWILERVHNGSDYANAMAALFPGYRGSLHELSGAFLFPEEE